MNIEDIKLNDVFRWSYNYEETKKRYGDNYIYWCRSQIGIIRKACDGLYLEDTFWSSDTNKSFSLEKCEQLLELTYLGNLDDFEQCQKYDQAMYDDKDILDLRHSNGGAIYLRKGTVKSKEKMIKVTKRNAYKIIKDLEYLQRSLAWELDKLKDVDNLNYVSALDKVSMSDVHYEDEELDQKLGLNK